ncbi:3'-5' exonuclease [Fibrobacter sp.]|uniref:3'-5' exonuclease n=1 Tax=Fibrobacter sp. TaxID=35828 RepID=UPI003865FCAF
MINELMIDIETTGQKPGCKVLTLGAFGFDKNGNQVEFYVRFDEKKMGETGFTDDPSTMAWWHKQSNAAYTEAFGGTVDPKEGLCNFKKWFYDNFNTDRFSGFRVWCCGLDFDFPILQEFMRVYGFAFPWKFWDQYDYRTIKNVFPIIKNEEGNTLKHTALEDAKAQMRGLRAFYKMVENRI